MSEKRYRMQRVNGALREVLSTRIGRGLKDPRLGFVTVTGVEATNDLRYARVYVSILGDEAERTASLAVLRSAEGVLQAAINEELHFRRTPELEFIYDESVDRGFRIDALIRAESELLDRSLDVDILPAEADSGDPVDSDGAPIVEDDGHGEVPEL